jgi:hypothetical protein
MNTFQVRFGYRTITGSDDGQFKGSSTEPGLTSFSSTSDTVVEYTETNIPPYTVERSDTPVFLVDDRDNDRGVVTSSTTMRYLFVRPDKTVSIYDLYTPGITETIIRRACYRINKKTSLADGTTIYTVDLFRGSPAAVGAGSCYLEYDQFNITSADVQGSASTAFAGTQVSFGGIDYIVTTEVDDKSVADLFGDFSIGLFKLSYPVGTDTNLYLGYDCNAPTGAGVCSSATDKKMIIKDYFIFRKPIYSCQFRMYDLGTNEYMMRLVDPDTTSNRITLRVDEPAQATPQTPPSLTTNTNDPTLTERGWSLVKQGSGVLIKLKWNFTKDYEQLITTSYLQNYSYLRVENNVPSITSEANANTFMCVKCTKIDPVTGTCSSETSMYIDDDMNPSTSPVLYSPLAISGVPPVIIEENFTLNITSSPTSFANVFDDGVVRFESSGDRFFTTQSGVTTLSQRSPVPRGVVFIGTTVTGGEILYAKLTGSTTKFVRATPPTVEEGFGWLVTTPNSANPSERNIVSYLDGSKGFMGYTTTTTFTFTVNNPKITVTPGSYDPNTNRIPLTVSLNPTSAIVAYKTGTGGTFSGASTTIHGAVVNALPGTLYRFKGSETNSALGTAETQVYTQSAPSLSITTNPTIGTVTFDTIPVSNNGVVANIGTTNSSVVVTATPTTGAVIKSTPVSYVTYRTSGVTVPVNPSTTYRVSIDFYRDSIDGTGTDTVGATLSTNTVTPAGPSIGTVTVSAGPPISVGYTVTGGSLSIPPTIYYFRQSTSTPVPTSASTWLPLGDGIVSTSSAAPTSTGSVNMNIVPDQSTNYYYFFKVGNVIGTGSAYVLASTLPSIANVEKQLIGGSGAGATNIPTTGTTDSTLVNSSGTVPVITYSGSNTMNIPITSKSRTKITYVIVFRTGTDVTEIQSLVSSTGTWTTGSLHVNIQNSTIIVACNGYSLIEGNSTDWTIPGNPISASTSYMLVLSIDSVSQTMNLRLNGSPYWKEFNNSPINILGNTNGLNIGNWSGDSGRGLNGKVAEFIFYNDVSLSGSDIVLVENYIRTKYTFTGTGTQVSANPSTPATILSITHWFDGSSTNKVRSGTNSITVNPPSKTSTKPIGLTYGLQFGNSPHVLVPLDNTLNKVPNTASFVFVMRRNGGPTGRFQQLLGSMTNTVSDPVSTTWNDGCIHIFDRGDGTLRFGFKPGSYSGLNYDPFDYPADQPSTEAAKLLNGRSILLIITLDASSGVGQVRIKMRTSDKRTFDNNTYRLTGFARNGSGLYGANNTNISLMSWRDQTNTDDRAFPATLGDFMVFNRVLTDADIGIIENYIDRKYYGVFF